MIIDYRLIPGDRIGATQVAITPATTGMSGGLMGVGKAKKEMQSVDQAVRGALGRSGLLVN